MQKSRKASLKVSNDLRVDAIYRNTNNWKNPEDIFNRFFRFADGKGINNTSGFRPKSKSNSSTDIVNCAFCILVTNFGETEWPDEINRETGKFTYYGDNRSPGKKIDDTTVGGNRLLEYSFTSLHMQRREVIPPFLCFESYKGAGGMFMRFLGLACPGVQGMSALEDLVAVWRIRGNQRFQNYRASFTVLREETVSKRWLEDLVEGIPSSDSAYCPDTWKQWVQTGLYNALRCTPQTEPRSKKHQLPVNVREWSVLKQIHEELSDREFEFAAAELIRFMDERFTDSSVTRAVRDGGRDVISNYRVGHDLHQIKLSAYVEAKKWKLTTAVGVKPMMRLIARLKYRDLGVFITTSFFDRQVQMELIEDRHPVILVTGGDIARLLIHQELDDERKLSTWISGIRKQAAENEGLG